MVLCFYGDFISVWFTKVYDFRILGLRKHGLSTKETPTFGSPNSQKGAYFLQECSVVNEFCKTNFLFEKEPPCDSVTDDSFIISQQKLQIL
jgi:hypothetical protein